MVMRGILILFTFAGSLFFATKASSQSVNSVSIGWTASSSSNVAGYYIYYGTSSGNYTTVVPVSNVTNVTISGLTSGVKYYFAATSYDSSYNQSAYSPEISAVVGSTGSIAATLTSTSLSSGGQFKFTVSGVAGSQYAVQASTDLVNWITLETNYSPFSFTDSNSSHFSHRYYRTAYISN
jgi:Fibronectin type III domain